MYILKLYSDFISSSNARDDPSYLIKNRAKMHVLLVCSATLLQNGEERAEEEQSQLDTVLTSGSSEPL